jgi:hypothetical protein
MKLLLTVLLNLSLSWVAQAADSREEEGPSAAPEPRRPVAKAADARDEEFTCPIDGTVWKQRIEGRGTPAGLRLDLKQVGDVVQPPSVPHCPKCGMILFSEKLPVEVINRLKPFILGPDYQMLASKSPVYANLAQIQEFLGAPPIYSAYSYLRASWEVEGKPAQHQRYLAKALEYFTRTLAGMEHSDKEWINIALLCGELERRLQKWDAATARFRVLGSPEQIKEEPRIVHVVARQLQLIEAKDSQPHILGDLSGATVKPGSKMEFARKPPEPPAAPKAPKKRLQPLDMQQSLVMNVEEPPLPQPTRRVRMVPNLDLRPEPEPEPAAGNPAPPPKVVTEPAPKVEKPNPVVVAKTNTRPKSPLEDPWNTEDAEVEPTKFPDLQEAPAPKVEPKPLPRHKAGIPKPEIPKPVAKTDPPKVDPPKPAPKPAPKSAPKAEESDPPKPAPKPAPKAEQPKSDPPKPAPKTEVAKEDEPKTEPPKPAPPKRAEKIAVVKKAPPAAKPKPAAPAAVVAPTGETKSRPKLIGD